MSKGIFITFEGGDGSGKSSQVAMLAKYLKDQKIPINLTREPGGCEIAEKIRKVVLTGEVDSLDAFSEFLLFTAARHEHVRQKIKPLLQSGQWVLSDRFYHSSYVYQSFSGGLDFDFVQSLTKKAIEEIEPNITIVLDIDPKIGVFRAKGRDLFQDELRMENKEFEFHQKNRQGFLNLAKNSDTMVIINANQSLEKVHQDIINTLKDRKII